MKRVLSGVIGACCALLAVAPAAAATEVRPTADRVFIFSVPTLGFNDVDTRTMPNLHRFLDQAAIADLSTRVDGMETTLADGYATLGAGTRTRGATREAGWAFDADEPFGSGTAGEEYTRRTAVPADGELVYLSQPSLRSANRTAQFGTELGALGTALEKAGLSRAVIANADAIVGPGGVRYERTAQTALADGTGRVPRGQLASSLLVSDPRAAFGVRLDPEAVARVFDANWSGSGVVLVEASDLWRAELAGRSVPDGAAQAQYARETSDAMFARLLERVDPSRDAVLVVAPRYAGSGLALTIAALQAPGVPTGLLQSATTRRAGFVQLVDVAPTVLSLVGVSPPDSMEGRPFTPAGGAQRATSRRATLVAADEAARFRDRMIGPVTAMWILGQVLLCGVAVAVFTWSRARRLQPVLAPGALGLLAVPLGLWLAGLVAFHEYGAFEYAVFVVGVAAAVSGLAWIGLRRAPFDPLIGVLAATVGFLVLDVATGAHLQFNTAFGYSPTIAGRFAGLGNLAYSILGAAAIFLAGLLAHRMPGRKGRALAAGVLVLVCLVDGLPFLGADVGGMLSLIPASAVLLWLLAGRRIRPRVALMGAVVTVGIVLAVGFADLARPSARRTHLGRLFERVGDQGWEGLWVVLRRKAEANLGVLGVSIWTLLIPVLFILLGVLLYRAPGRLRLVKQAIPEMHATLVSFGVLAVLGFALNDSGIAIPGVMLGVANTVLVYLSARIEEPNENVIVLAEMETVG